MSESLVFDYFLNNIFKKLVGTDFIRACNLIMLSDIYIRNQVDRSAAKRYFVRVEKQVTFLRSVNEKKMRRKTNRLYKDLAWLWPVWEDLKVYRKESDQIAKLVKKHAKIKVRTLLDIGCGGGKNAFHLKKHFEVTGIDISKSMLSNARKLNPECEFVVADMRNFDLKKEFDSVFMNDAHNYMTTRSDLLKTFKMAYRHLRPGGVMIVHPDQTKSTFKQNSTHIWRSQRGDMDITFIENNYDPDPRDNTFESTFVFLIRKKGKLRIEHDFHLGGLFTLNTWRKLLKQAGFKVYEEKNEETESIPTFACVKPAQF